MLPSQQYFLELQDTAVAAIDENTAVVTGLERGRTKVFLHDHNVDEKEAGIRVPSALLTVSDPVHLTLAILPHRNWILMIDEHYEIVVEMYDRYEKFLHIYRFLKYIFVILGFSHVHKFPFLILFSSAQITSFHHFMIL